MKCSLLLTFWIHQDNLLKSWGLDFLDGRHHSPPLSPVPWLSLIRLTYLCVKLFRKKHLTPKVHFTFFFLKKKKKNLETSFVFSSLERGSGVLNGPMRAITNVCRAVYRNTLLLCWMLTMTIRDVTPGTTLLVSLLYCTLLLWRHCSNHICFDLAEDGG